MVSCHTYSRLFTSVAPMYNVMTAAKTLVFAHVVSVNIRAVAAHCLGKREYVLPAGSYKRVPQPQCRNKLGALPCVAAEIVTPAVTLCVIGVHNVAVIPQAVPAALLNFIFVEVERLIHFVLKPLFKRRRAVWQAPVTEYFYIVIIFRCTEHNRRFLYRVSVLHYLLV